MLPPTPSAIPHEHLGAWLTVAAFGAYHGLNPGMGWLFALALGLQQQSERAIWLAMVPIAIGHATSVALVAGAVLALGTVVRPGILELIAAAVLLGFGLYKLRTYYRHPRWVGMKVRAHDLVAWSFLMATAHGAGLMIAPALVVVAAAPAAMPGMPGMHEAPGTLAVAVGLHTAAMLLVMGTVAWIVYRKVGLAVLRRSWVNFDLIWAIALLAVGALATLFALWNLHGGAPMP